MYFDQSAFGKRLKEKRNERKMSQAEIAEKLNISSNHYGHIEQGIKGCSIDLLLELSDILQVSTDYLLLGQSSVREAEIKKLKSIVADMTELICQMS